MPYASEGQKYPCEVCGKSISNNGLGRSSHLRMHQREEEWDNAEIEIYDEECITHHPLRNKKGKLFIEARIIGRMRINGKEHHWNKVITVPLHPENELADDDYFINED